MGEKIDGEFPSPTFIDVEQASTGWINKYVLTYRLPSGKDHIYESVSRKPLDIYERRLESGQHWIGAPDAVCIVPILDDGSFMLIREFRYPLNAWCVAFPAGLMDPGDTIETCVKRELQEETGCILMRDDEGRPRMNALPKVSYSSVGMSDENIQIVLAHVEQQSQPDPEKTEFIHPFILTRREIRNFMDTTKYIIGTRTQLLLYALSGSLEDMLLDF